jgi:hypothetical protein
LRASRKIVRPPLTPLTEPVQSDLLKKLALLNFEMPVEQ